MKYRQLCGALVIVSLGCGCTSQRAEPSPAQNTPAAAAAGAARQMRRVAYVYGVVRDPLVRRSR